MSSSDESESHSSTKVQKRPSGTRPKKRTFSGNRFTKKSETAAASTSRVFSSPISASKKKLRSSLNPEVEEARESWNGFRIVDIDLFLDSIENSCVCKICFNRVKVQESFQCGLSSQFTVSCTSCDFSDIFRNSSMLSKNVAEVNRRAVYAFKSVGLGYSSYKEVCALMDLPKPIAHTTFDRSIDAINEASTKVAEKSMKQAALEEIAASKKNNVTVSGDGSWQKRGFSSLFGLVSLIGLLTGVARLKKMKLDQEKQDDSYIPGGH